MPVPASPLRHRPGCDPLLPLLLRLSRATVPARTYRCPCLKEAASADANDSEDCGRPRRREVKESRPMSRREDRSGDRPTPDALLGHAARHRSAAIGALTVRVLVTGALAIGVLVTGALPVAVFVTGVLAIGALAPGVLVRSSGISVRKKPFAACAKRRPANNLHPRPPALRGRHFERLAPASARIRNRSQLPPSRQVTCARSLAASVPSRRRTRHARGEQPSRHAADVGRWRVEQPASTAVAPSGRKTPSTQRTTPY